MLYESLSLNFSNIVAPLMLSVLIYIDYFLIHHRIQGEISGAGFLAFSRVMQLGYFNRILIFVFQFSIAISIDAGLETSNLLSFLLFFPALTTFVALGFHRGNQAEITKYATTSNREKVVLAIAYTIFCCAWIMPIIVNIVNDDLKSVAMTSVTLANGISGFIITFFQEPIIQRCSKSKDSLNSLLRDFRLIRMSVSVVFIFISVAIVFWSAK